jgi:hypothetical protein
VRYPRCVEYKVKCNIKIYNTVIHVFIFYCIILDYNSSCMFRPSCGAIFRLIFEQVECIIYILYYILACVLCVFNVS